MKVSEFTSAWEEARVDVALARQGYVREIGKLDGVARFLDRVYETLTGEEPPEFEPEDLRVRKVS